jgi:outer membrane protein assembly factor BamB
MSVNGSAARIQWQGAPYGRITPAGSFILGWDYFPTENIRALSAATGAEAWSTALETKKDPNIVEIIPGNNVVVVETGHCFPSPAAPTVITGAHVLELTTGKELWSHPLQQTFDLPAIAVAADRVIIGDTDGTLTAYADRTGAIVWSRPRPRDCRTMNKALTDSPVSVAADGGQIVAAFLCEPNEIVERMSPQSGAADWDWIGPRPSSGNGRRLDVVGTAVEGGVVLLAGGVFPSAESYAGTLPHPRSRPTELGPTLDGKLLVALDSTSGQPRWTERGGQLESFVLTDGVVCESVRVGVECRDDVSGLPSRPNLITGYLDSDSPSVIGDGYAGIAGSLIAVAVREGQNKETVVVSISSVHSDAVVSRLAISGIGQPKDCSGCPPFVIGAASVPQGYVFLLRRTDLGTYPVDAILVGKELPDGIG